MARNGGIAETMQGHGGRRASDDRETRGDAPLVGIGVRPSEASDSIPCVVCVSIYIQAVHLLVSANPN